MLQINFIPTFWLYEESKFPSCRNKYVNKYVRKAVLHAYVHIYIGTYIHNLDPELSPELYNSAEWLRKSNNFAYRNFPHQ